MSASLHRARLMLAGLLLGFVRDRRLLREAEVNLAIRWFIGYGLHERLPDHSRPRPTCWPNMPFAAGHRAKLHSVNPLERLNGEVKPRAPSAVSPGPPTNSRPSTTMPSSAS